MKFKDLFDKEVLKEQYVRKELKIIYELNLDLYKPKAEQPEQAQMQQPQVQAPEQQIANNPVAPMETPQPEQQPTPTPENPQQPTTEQPEVNNQESSSAPTAALNAALSSVVTEEDEASVNDGDKIMRKFEGEVNLSNSQKDKIQCFDDVIDTLSKFKKDGNDILDDFCVEIITLCANQQFDQIKQKIDKKSKIWVEIYYGYNKDDSIGIRFSKRPNADTMTSTMLLDNEIISTKFSIDKINQKISEYRNYDVKKS